MHWLVLVVSGVLEAVWATALGKSQGFTRLTPSVVFAMAAVVSFAGLAFAMRGLPVGTAYAVWVGIGAALTAGYAMLSGDEPASTVRVLLLAGSSAA
jgi:quaternary ammonium compound-resistance protein SugE